MLHSIDDPDLRGILLTDVDVSKDLKTASVYYTIPDRSKEKRIDERFKKAAPFFRRKLQKLDLRYLPELKFFLDTKRESVYRVLGILDEMSKERPPNVL